MNKQRKIALGLVIAALLIAVFSVGPKITKAFIQWQIGPALPPYTYSFVNATGTQVLKAGSGELGTIVVGTPAAGDVITLYDSATTTIFSANTTATGTISVGTSTTATTTEISTAILTIGSSGTATSTATGTYQVTVNGFTIVSTSTPNGSTTANIATNLVTAINAATSSDQNVSATSTTNVITLTASSTGSQYTISASFPVNPQNGVTSTVTSIIPGSNGLFSVTLNGFTVSTSTNNGSTTVNVATTLTSAINAASSSALVTATSTNNIITVTANTSGAQQMQIAFPTNPQNNVTLTASTTPGYNKTNTIAVITLPATTTYYSTPQESIFDAQFLLGLTETVTGSATSSFTANYY
jgi:hypothetical protein